MAENDEKIERVNVLGIEIHRISLDETVRWVMRRLNERGKPVFVVTPNVDHTNHYRKNADYRMLIRDAALVVADGVPLLWAARLFGKPLKGRVNGTDLFERLTRACAEEGRSVFLMGGMPGVAEKCAKKLNETSPALKIAGTYAPAKGYLDNRNECEKMVRLAQNARPDVLFLGLPGPGAEMWIHRHYREAGALVSINVGASFDFVSGEVRRAPKFFQKVGLEWLYRLLRQPGKLWRRYIIGNPRFVFRVFVQCLKRPGKRGEKQEGR
jgi:N-acetylglucosaminyldiphosphoundecaprenol N-acetyl-beta-D-mannosaminyltransferase